uniref:Uncharacterized protein n=1 Tax=Pararge aegeria TaxID=116150 RepID=S4P939_9NEOP
MYIYISLTYSYTELKIFVLGAKCVIFTYIYLFDRVNVNYDYYGIETAPPSVNFHAVEEVIVTEKLTLGIYHSGP